MKDVLVKEIDREFDEIYTSADFEGWFDDFFEEFEELSDDEILDSLDYINSKEFWMNKIEHFDLQEEDVDDFFKIFVRKLIKREIPFNINGFVDLRRYK